jgi:hypothetical protein
MSLRVHRQIGPAWKILPEQTIGVLVGSALPGTLRVAEVNLDVGRQRKSPNSVFLAAFSVAEATRSRSPGVSSVTFRAQSPDLRFAPLMDMDFAVSRPLVRRSRLVSGSCPSTCTFALRFLQTSPRGDSPCVVTNPSPPSGWVEDFHLQAAEHAQHTTNPLSREGAGPAVGRIASSAATI